MTKRCRIFSTQLGEMAIVANSIGLLRILLPDVSSAALQKRICADFPRATEDAALAPELVAQLQAYAAGEAHIFNVRRDERNAAPFDRAVWRACAEVPFGCTVTYAELARRAGRPRAARAVGSAMARNRWPIVVPCHRVVRGDGGLGGFSAPAGTQLKQTLLDLERAAAPGV